MNFVKKFFPFSFGTTDVKGLVIRALIYYFAPTVLGVIIGIVSALVGAICGILELPAFLVLLVTIPLGFVSSVFGIYCLAGLVFLFLGHFKVIK